MCCAVDPHQTLISRSWAKHNQSQCCGYPLLVDPNLRPHMNQPPLFEASVPVLVRYLGSLDRILVAVELLAPEQASHLLVSRLAKDMLPFAQQVETAAYLALRTAYPLAGRALPPFFPSDASLPGLRGTVARNLALIQALAPDEFIHAQNRIVQEKAGNALIELPAPRFLAEFALPNFFFHLNMAYAIARAHGCALGKAQYDGFHVYPCES